MAKNNFRPKKTSPTTLGADGGGAAGGVGKETAAPSDGPEMNPGDASIPFPLFYKDPQPLHNELHKGKGLKQPIDYRFAASTHAVVLLAEEFRLAAAHYPIIFADDDTGLPLALLGYREGRNVFVDEAGAWAGGAYVPAYVRRYPFAVGTGAKQDETILYVDLASDLVVDLEAEPGAEALFVDGEPSERTTQAREFCAAFQQQVPATTAFVEEVRKRELLGSKEVKLDVPSGQSQVLTGLRIIEEEKFNALPDEVFLEWRHRGWIALVHWHWISMDNFLRFLHRG